MSNARLPQIVVAVLAAALVVGGGIAFFQDRDDPAPTEAAPGGTEVAIAGFTFGPPDLTVAVGDTVTWTNEDNTQHTVTGKGTEAKTVLDSENLRNTDTFEATFDAPGAFEYLCVFHPNMVGTITVEG